MNLFKQIGNTIINNTLIGKTSNLIYNFYNYYKDYSYISDTLYSDEFKLVLKNYLKINIKKDWIGRLYGIINPNIDINGKLDINNMVIEIDGENSNTSEYVKSWTYKQLTLISNLFKIEKLYDYIDLTFKHVGPVEHDNYLLVFDIVSRKIMVSSLKKWFKHLSFYLIIFGIIYTTITIL